MGVDAVPHAGGSEVELGRRNLEVMHRVGGASRRESSSVAGSSRCSRTWRRSAGRMGRTSPGGEVVADQRTPGMSSAGSKVGS